MLGRLTNTADNVALQASSLFGAGDAALVDAAARWSAAIGYVVNSQVMGGACRPLPPGRRLRSAIHAPPSAPPSPSTGACPSKPQASVAPAARTCAPPLWRVQVLEGYDLRGQLQVGGTGALP